MKGGEKMDILNQCKTLFEFVTVLPTVFPNCVVKNNTNSGRVEVSKDGLQIVAYYDGNTIVNISKSFLLVA